MSQKRSVLFRGQLDVGPKYEPRCRPYQDIDLGGTVQLREGRRAHPATAGCRILSDVGQGSTLVQRYIYMCPRTGTVRVRVQVRSRPPCPRWGTLVSALGYVKMIFVSVHR
jgi:hypothetical protein